MTPVRTESSDAKFATKSLRAQIHEAGPNPSMKKNRRLLVSIPRYFITALLRPRPPSRGADAGLLLLYVGTTVRIRYTIPVPRNAACGVREPAVKAPGGRAARHQSIRVLPFDALSLIHI